MGVHGKAVKRPALCIFDASDPDSSRSAARGLPLRPSRRFRPLGLEKRGTVLETRWQPAFP